MKAFEFVTAATVALIDGDILAYRAAASVEAPIKWDDDQWTLHASLSDAKERALAHIEQIMHSTQANKALLAFSGAQPFRKMIYAPYKSHRQQRKPVVFPELVEWFLSNELEERGIYGIRRQYLEADDIISMLCTSPPDPAIEFVVASIDKDFKQIPNVRIYNWNDNTFARRTALEALKNKYIQALTGDRADGYPGCPGIGPKSAETILEGATTNQDMWARVRDAFIAAGQTEDHAIVNIRMAHLLWDGEFDTEEMVVWLWSPPVAVNRHYYRKHFLRLSDGKIYVSEKQVVPKRLRRNKDGQ